jgi:glycosyltransferase involved in cell wall biosynthesis
MKVALVADWFLKYASEQAIGLRHAGAEVMLVCRDHFQEFGGDRSEWEAVQAKVRSAGVETRVITGRTSSLSAMRSTVSLRAHLQRWKPDLIHAHPSIDPWLHLVMPRRPLVLTIHDVTAHPGQPQHGLLKRTLSDAWRRRADAFVVHGERLAADLRPQAGGRPIAVLPHGVAPTAEPYAVPPRPTLLFFGRLEPYKGLSVLIEAMGPIWSARPEVELVVAGRGPSSAEVPDHPRIRRVFRYVPEAEVDVLLRATTLVVAPYLEASQSGVVALAVARGIPAIVSDKGALPDVVPDASMVVPAGDPAALAAAVLAHLSDGKEVRARIHEQAVTRLSWDASGVAALDFYRQILGF